MKFTAILIAVFAAFGVNATLNTNAERFAHGLGPLPPVRRTTPVAAARRHQPSQGSGIKNSCNSGPVQCCNSVTNANPAIAGIIKQLLGIVVPANTAIGLTCHPLSVIGIGGNHCQSQAVCCENNHFNGVIAIGCSPINING